MSSLEETFRTILAARLPHDPKWTAWIDGAVAELAANVPPQGIDRDALLSARRRIAVLYTAGVGGEAAALDLRLAVDEIDAALALVRPVEGIDRGEARQFVDNIIISRMLGYGTNDPTGAIIDYFEALVRPIEGVTLTPEEAARALSWYESLPGLTGPDYALAARLEAAQ